MSAEAIAIGTEVIALEARLERLFADRKADVEQTLAAVDQIGAAQARLRFVHLKYHLAMAAAMTFDQIADYSKLRGYAAVKH